MNQTRFETWLFAFSRGFSLSLFPMWKETKGTVLLNLSNQRDGINSNNPWHELILNFSRLSPLLPQTIMEAWSQKAELSNGSSSCVRQTAKRTSSLLNLVSGFHLYSGKITPSFKSLPQVLSVSTLDCNWSPLIFFSPPRPLVLWDPLFWKDLMLRLLLCVSGRPDEIWIGAPAELCELCLRWFASWVSEKPQPCQSLPTLCFSHWMSVRASTHWARHVLCTTCNFPISSASVCAPDALRTVPQQWWTWRPRQTDRNDVMKIAYSDLCFLPSSITEWWPMIDNQPSAAVGCCWLLGATVLQAHSSFWIFLISLGF